VCRSGASRRLSRVVLIGLLLLVAASGEAQPEARQILVLQSSNRGNLSLDSFFANFHVDLEERAGEVNVVQVVVGPSGFVVAPELAIVDYIRSTFVNHSPPDLIVTIGSPAAAFARKYRRQIFPDTPLLLASIDEQHLREAPLGDNETAVAVVNDLPQLVDDILRLLPETRQLFMVMGPGPQGTFWRRELEDQFARFRDRLTFLWANDLSFQEVVRRAANLPRHSAILYINLTTDAQGGTYADERVLADLHASANAPMFGRHTVMLGRGIVGGRLVSIEDLSRSTADVASRLLQGAPPASVRVPPHVTGPPTFDWRELQRWRIAESRLPAGSIMGYRSPSLWQEHRLTVVGTTAALAIQALLIIGLLYERHQRQRAELDSRRNLALATDASRRQMMSALTSSIAHDLGQPLSSMIHNTQALEMMIAADRAPADTVREILSDIRSQGVQATQIIDRTRTMLRAHQLDMKPLDLHVVISESLALLASDMRARQIQASVTLSPTPCLIKGDQVLLQQVLVNLVMNAMDAMAQTPPARRRVTISTDIRAVDVEVSVHDSGTGLPAQIEGALFAPFATTKEHGLGVGLTIVRTIIDAHGGTIDARDNPEGGATFTVRLRRTDVPGILSGAA